VPFAVPALRNDQPRISFESRTVPFRRADGAVAIARDGTRPPEEMKALRASPRSTSLSGAPER
jgi:hypothetical protein